MIVVNVDLKDKDFEKRIGKVLSSSFSVNLSDKISDRGILITDYTDETSCRGGVIYLTDKRELCHNNVVYRFESAKHMCKKVLYEYCSYYDDYTMLALGSPCSIIGVCSARGGTGCSCIAIGAAQEMQRTRKQEVLYVSLDIIPYFPFEAECEMNINRLLFVLFTKGFRKEDLQACISLDEHKVSHLNYVRPYNRLLQIKDGEFVKFITMAAESGMFTYIVLDIGSGMGNVYDKALSLCDKVIKVSDERKDICMKDIVYDNHLRGLATGEIINVVNRCASGDIETENTESIYMDYCPDDIVLKDRMIYVSPEKEMNVKINELVDKIMAK